MRTTAILAVINILNRCDKVNSKTQLLEKTNNCLFDDFERFKILFVFWNSEETNLFSLRQVFNSCLLMNTYRWSDRAKQDDGSDVCVE